MFLVEPSHAYSVRELGWAFAFKAEISHTRFFAIYSSHDKMDQKQDSDTTFLKESQEILYA